MNGKAPEITSSYGTNIDFAQITRDALDVYTQKLVQAKHVSFLRE